MGIINPDTLLAIAEFMPFVLFLASLGLVVMLAVVCGQERDVIAGLLGLGCCAALFGFAWLGSSTQDDIYASQGGFAASHYVSTTNMFMYCLIFTGVCAVIIVFVEMLRAALDAHAQRVVESYRQSAETSAPAAASCSEVPVTPLAAPQWIFTGAAARAM